MRPAPTLLASGSVALVLALSGCPDREPPSQGHPHPEPAHPTPHAPQPDARPFNPMTIGSGGPGSGVPQVRFPARPVPPEPLAAPPPLGPVASVATRPHGGALLAWTAPDPQSPAQRTIVALRAVDRAGAPGPAFVVQRTPGHARAVAIAPSEGDDEAAVLYAAEYGGTFQRIALQRTRPDGTRLGIPSVLGNFRALVGTDDPLGLVALAGAEPGGYLLALRGVVAPCDAGRCGALQVLRYGTDGELASAGSVRDTELAPPALLLVPPGVPDGWNAAVGVGAAAPPAEVRVLGPGPLARLAVPAGAALVGAWLDGRGARALVQLPPSSGHGSQPALALVGASPAPQPVEHTRVVCTNNVAAEELTGRGLAVIVPVTATGAAALLARDPALRARGVREVAWTGDGLLLVREGALEFARCDGSALGAVVPVVW